MTLLKVSGKKVGRVKPVRGKPMRGKPPKGRGGRNKGSKARDKRNDEALTRQMQNKIDRYLARHPEERKARSKPHEGKPTAK